jgi:molecular chaperone HtpG
MAAERVELVTRRAGETEATRWESNGDGTYQVTDTERAGRGTTVTLHLKAEDRDNGIEDWSDRWVISRIVRRYSDFVSYPILLTAEKDPEIEDLAKEKETGEKPKMPLEEKVLNSMKPIWTRPQSEVTSEQYNEFYRHISHDWSEPLKVVSFKAEGRIEYQALLFVPSQAPYDLYYVASKVGLQLYVKRIFIADEVEDLLPHYLRFVRGVVDSARPGAQRVARDAAAGPPHHDDPQGSHQEGAGHLHPDAREGGRHLPQVLGRVRPRHQGRYQRRLREQGNAP